MEHPHAASNRLPILIELDPVHSHTMAAVVMVQTADANHFFPLSQASSAPVNLQLYFAVRKYVVGLPAHYHTPEGLSHPR